MENGFKVNTEVEVKRKRKKKKKFNIVRFIRKNFIVCVCAAALLLVVLFCSIVPVCNQYYVTLKTSTKADGSIEYIEKYNADGIVTEINEYYEGDVMCVTLNTVEKGKKVKTQISYWNELFQTIDYEYKGNKLTKETTKDREDKVEKVKTYYYDEKGLLLNAIVTDASENQLYRYDYTFENGVLVEEVMYDVEYDYTRTVTYTYEGGKLVSENVVAGAYHNMTTEYTYNGKGFVSMSKTDSGEDNYRSFTYEYGKNKVSIFKKIF